MFGLSKEDIKNLMFFLKYITKHRFKFIAVIFFQILGTILEIAGPLIWGKIVFYLTMVNKERVVRSILIYLMIRIVSCIVGFIQSIISVRLENGISCDINKDLYHKMASFPMKVFDNFSHGEIMSRLNGDSGVVTNFFSNKILVVGFNIFKAGAMVLICIRINLILSLIVFMLIPATSFIYKVTGKVIREKNKELKRISDQIFGCINQTIKGISDIRAFGNTKKIVHDYDELIKGMFNKKTKASDVGIYGRNASNLTTTIMNILIIVFGAVFVLNSTLTLDLYIAFFSYSGSLTATILELTSLNTTLQQGIVSVNRLIDFNNNLGFEKKAKGDTEITEILEGINFKDVTFQYEHNQMVLKDISFDLPIGKKVGIIGRSGSGKSTIVNLIMGFYEVSKGHIEIDSINMKDIDEESLYKQIAVVRQEPYLFNQSIKINLMLAKQDATDREIEDACRKAQIHDFIMSLPNQYDSFIGENGTKLSGGQKQRIAIAKALLKEAPILIFDESTSALDNETQELISNVIDDISNDHSVIIITHKLQTVKECHKIIMIDESKVQASGTHEELLENSDLYRSLYEKESIDYIA